MIGRLEEVLKVTKQEVEKGLELHNRYIVCDGSCGEPCVWTEEMAKKANVMLDAGMNFDEIMEEYNGMKLNALMTDPRYREAFTNVLKKAGVSSFAKEVDHPSFWGSVAQWTYKFENLDEIFLKFTKTEDIRKAKKEGRTAVLWYAQHQIEYIGRDLSKLELFQRIGVKLVHIAHNQRNYFGDGGNERTDCGLSYLGLEAVAKMNELGILIDTSHTGHRTTVETAENSRDGITACHTGCREIYDHPHNKWDEALKAIAEGGGVIGVYMSTVFLSERKGTIIDWLNHIDHAVNVMGVDHVGIGTENYERTGEPRRLSAVHDEWYRSPVHGVRPGDVYNTSIDPPWPEEIESWSKWPNLTIGLVSRGYSDKEIQKIIGGNWLRLYDKVLDRGRR